MHSRLFKYALVISSLLVLLSFAPSQTNWQRFPGNPVVPVGIGSPTFEHTFAPSVLYDSVASIYKMWFSSVVVGGSTWNVSYATSLNGTTWDVYSGSPVLRVGPSGSFDSQWLTDPFVFRTGGGYRMYYTGYDGVRWQTGLATSVDGITWTKHSGNPILRVVPGTWEAVGTNCPKVYFNGSMYTMMYSGYDGTNYSIGLATSTDGVIFTKHALNPVLRKGAPSDWDANSVFMNSFVHHNGKFYLLYNGGPYAPVGFATSTDGGVSWAKYPGNPVFTTGPSGSWDGSRVTVGSLLVTGSEFRYWYTGCLTTSRDKWQIGYATGSFAPPIVPNDTVASYHLDETTPSIVIDSSPYRSNGNAIGTTVVSGRLGNARNFNGVGDYILIPYQNSAWDFPSSQSFTIDAWFKTTQTDVGDIVRRGLATLPGFAVRIAYGRVQGIIGNREDGRQPDTLLRITSDRSNYNDGQWHNVRMVRDRGVGRLYLYVDGVQATAPLTDPFPYNLASDRALTIGAWQNLAVPGYFRGTIDEVAIYRSARHGGSAPTIQVLPEAINFGIVPVGNLATLAVQITNLGLSDTLHISSISSNHSVFTASLEAIGVPPGSSRIVDVRYAPVAAVVDTGSLSIASDDPNRPIVRAQLNGRGFAPSASPVVSSIRDIPEDQGKQVRVIWYRSMYDGINDSLHIVQYNVWRRVGNTGLWDFIETIPAVRFDQYAYVAPTLFDSSRTGIRWSVFRVSAHTANGAQVFFSAADSGYSVDNLPPFAPTNLVAGLGSGQVHLSWDLPTDPDVVLFSVYRSDNPNYIPSDQYLIGTTTLNMFTDLHIGGSTRYYYYVVAQDSTGNLSPPSNQATVFVTSVGAGNTTPAEFQLYQNYPNPFNPSSIIRYDIPSRTHALIRIYDVVGKEVATVVDDDKSAGRYEVLISGDKLSSGVYLYRMQAGRFVSVKKMILMK